MGEESFEKTSKEIMGTTISDEAREKANAQLREWYVNFIKLFREKFSTLSKEEKSCLDNTIDYSNPCQIEVFWIANPPMQLIIQSNLGNKKDRDIIINGPFTTNEFLDKVNSILQEPRWNQTTSNPYRIGLDSNHQYTYAEHLAVQLHKLMEYVKYSLFNSVDAYVLGIRYMLDDKVWMQHCIGNIGKEKYEKLVERIIKNLKIKAKQKKEESEKNNLKKQTENQVTELTAMEWNGFAIRLFPSHVIGKKLRPTISELLYGISRLDHTEKIFDLKIDDCVIIVNKDGLIFVEFEDKANAVIIFNVMMGLGIFEGFTLFAVRELDLSHAYYNKYDLTVSREQWNLQTTRSSFRDFNLTKDYYLNYQIKEIPINQLQSIIQKAFKICSNEKLAENLCRFAESFTHLENGEYAQSFRTSWGVIETKYFDMWKTTLAEMGLSDEKYNKQIKQGQRSFDRVLKDLNQSNSIDDQKYNHLIELKKKRNKIVHSEEIGSYEDAKRCLGFITNILKNEVSILEQK